MDLIPPMRQRRCGHSAVGLFDGSVMVVGGYEGGVDYLATAELLDPSLSRWISLPPMNSPRSGMAASIGPGGAVYVVGGSPDGSGGHRSMERSLP